ncbi:MAG: hypothetical protein FJX21_04215 [Alphaproteobacteria bacterium]|nr:hypothetical protein [Alphaproteobacteria bacterium]
MQIRPNAAFLQAISRATEARQAAFADRLAEIQRPPAAAKPAPSAAPAAVAAQPASGVAAPQSPLSSQRPAHAQEPMRPRGSVLNILV